MAQIIMITVKYVLIVALFRNKRNWSVCRYFPINFANVCPGRDSDSLSKDCIAIMNGILAFFSAVQLQVHKANTVWDSDTSQSTSNPV